MKVKVTTPFDGVPDGEVYPKRFKEGDIVAGELAAAAVRNGWGEEVGDSETPNEARAARGLPPIEPPPVFRAKLTKKHTHEGESYASGLVVEGDLARLFVEQGVAKAMAPADKSVTSVPETK